MHFCGNPFHDIPMLLWVLAMEAPMIGQAMLWLRSKLRRSHKHTSKCSHG